MGKSAAKSISDALQSLGALGAVDGHMVPKRLLPGNRAYLDGNLVRRKLPPAPTDYDIRDTELAGFGMRVRLSGKRYWFVRFRQRGRHRRVSLGRVDEVEALTARGEARKLLAEVALDGLPRRVAAKIAPILSDYADEFWTDYRIEAEA